MHDASLMDFTNKIYFEGVLLIKLNIYKRTYRNTGMLWVLC